MLSLIELEKQYGRINPSFLGFECKMNEFYKVSFFEIMKKSVNFPCKLFKT